MNPNDNRNTLVKFGKDAVDAVYKGVREVTEATATTLGPMGRNVLIDKGYETVILHDGVSVANAIVPKGEFERNGAKVIQEAAKKQRDEVGDGTTAVMILAQALLDETLKATSGGVNPMSLRRGLEMGRDKVVVKLQELSRPVKSLEQKTQIATISAEDSELGKMIAKILHEIGDEGVLTVEKSKAQDTFHEIQEGMQVDKGYAHPFMITDPERQIAVLEDAHILITDHALTTIQEIGEFLDKVVFPNTRKVLFIAPDIGVEFMQVLLNAKLSGQFLGIAMRAPGIASAQVEMMQDLCALTGATLVTKEAGMKFTKDTPFDVLGQAQRIVLSKISTIITSGAGHKDDVRQRIAVIRKQMEDDTLSEFELEQLKGRLAKLTNGVAVIKVGGNTEVEMKERYERALDAVQATQSAVKHGLVAGGEVSYLACTDELDERDLGQKILKDALKAPFKRLVENAGYDSGEVLSELKQEPKLNNKGFDVLDGEEKDMVKAGIIDPVSVPINAVKSAVSVAVALSSLGAAVVLENEMPLVQQK